MDFVYDNLGNIECAITKNGMKLIADIPEYNVITEDDDLQVKKAKQKVQKEQYSEFNVTDSTEE